MRYILALVSLGLFGWLAFAVFTGTPPLREEEASGTGTFGATVSTVTGTLGAGLSAAILVSVGLVLAWVILRRSEAAA